MSIGHGGQTQAAVEPGRVQRAMDPIVDQIARRRARQQLRFRLTVFLTWFVLVGLLVGGLWAAGKIDIDFLREWQAFILGGISLTLVISASSIFFAMHPGDPRRARTAVVQRRDLRHRQLLRLARARHAAHRPDPVHLPRPAPDLARLRGRPDDRPRDLRAGLQLRRVHDRDLPGRDPGRSRAARSRPRTRSACPSG